MLPVISTPKYSTILPSTGKTIKFRPFLVKEEKALLIAQQSEELDVIVSTINDIITSCTDGKLNPEILAIFDIEWMIIQLRARSAGEVVELTFDCEDGCDKSDITVSIDLLSLKMENPPEHTNKIVLFEDIGVVMKYPSLQLFKELELAVDDTTEEVDIDKLFDIISRSIESVFSSETVYPASENTKEELNEFLNNLTKEQFDMIQNFFKTMPKLSKTIEYKCPICNKPHTKVLEGFQSFFQ